MKLNEITNCCSYDIKDINENNRHRFMAYGFFVGVKIKVVSIYKKMLIVNVCNSLYAINDSFASNIEVVECE